MFMTSFLQGPGGCREEAPSLASQVSFSFTYDPNMLHLYIPESLQALPFFLTAFSPPSLLLDFSLSLIHIEGRFLTRLLIGLFT